MPAPFGPIDSGFSRKSLAEVLRDIELSEQLHFGPSIVFDAQSPLGNWNGVLADALREAWEMGEGVYYSLDVDQASGARLDLLGKLTHTTRATGESDADYRQRIKNTDNGNIKLSKMRNDIFNISGVSWVNITENRTDGTVNGLPSHSLGVAVVGGTDAEISDVIWADVAPGVGLFGNTPLTLRSDGLCRALNFIRPIDVTVSLMLDVSIGDDKCQCSPTSKDGIATSLAAVLNGNCGFYNGQLITPEFIRLAFNEADIQNAVVECVKFTLDGNTYIDTVAIDILERPVTSASAISVNFVTSGSGCA